MRKLSITIIVVIAVLIFGAINAAYVVPEGRQALITKFGAIIGEPITKAGLHFKAPFVNDVRYFDKRILSWDGDVEQIPTQDKKYIMIDTTARWRIKDVRKFAETVINENGAQDRLDGILDGITRDTISNNNLVEAVRNSNMILDQIAERLKAKKENPIEAAIEEEITGEIERIKKGREKLSTIIIKRARRELLPFGIELIDVQLRRISYEKSVEDKVYDRMISERNRIAEKIKSIGKGEEAIIKGRMNLELKTIESEAYRKAQEIKGKAEAESIAIYAKALSKEPEYYTFIRKLEAYKKSIPQKGNMILSTNSDFLKLLKKRN